MEDMAETSAGMTRRTLIKRGAVVGGTLMWAAPVIDSFTSPAFGAVEGTPLTACCRFTGGGGAALLTSGEPLLVELEPSAPVTIDGHHQDPNPDRNPRYGFQLYCGRPPSQPDHFTVTFFGADGDQVTFHLDADTYSSTCYGPPTTSPDAPCSILEGSGSGRVTGPGADDDEVATIIFVLRDVSEPAHPNDQVSFTITYVDDDGNTVNFSATGNPRGNIQAHRTTGSKGDC